VSYELFLRKRAIHLAAADNEVLDASDNWAEPAVNNKAGRKGRERTAKVPIFVHDALVACVHPCGTIRVDFDGFSRLLLVLPVPGRNKIRSATTPHTIDTHPFCKRYPLTQSSPGVFTGTTFPSRPINLALTVPLD
jgi:hypothetical protein